MDWGKIFSFDLESTESRVRDLPGRYYLTSPEALYTAPEDYESIFKALPDIHRWIEPGSGVGLGPLMFSYLHPDRASVGIEIDPARWQAATEMQKNKQITNALFILGDLLCKNVPVGDCYFLYLPTGPLLDKLLVEISKINEGCRIVAIESHGLLIPRLAKEAHLTLEQVIPLKSSRWTPGAHVYIKSGPRLALFDDFSFQKKYLLIQGEQGEEWLGESFGMEWERDDLFTLAIPPRTIQSSQVKEVLSYEELEGRWQFLTELRQSGECQITAAMGEMSGQLRKIIVSPSLVLEFSSSVQVKWDDIRTIRQENILCYDSSSCSYHFPSSRVL